jgi:citrate synthase
MFIRKKILIVTIITGCIASYNLFASSEVTQEQVAEAVYISYVAQLQLGLPTIIGKETEGVKLDKEKNIFIYTNCDITELSESDTVKNVKYTRMSGKVKLQGELVIFNVKLTGGPVSTLKYEISLKQVKKLKSTKVKKYQIEVEANGKKYTVNLVKAFQHR